MTRCPLCAGTGDIPTDTTAATVNELRNNEPWRADLCRLLALLHKAVVDDQIERDKERRQRKATA